MPMIWLTWEKQRRNYGISSEMGFELHEILCNKSGIARYFYCVISTLLLIHNLRPSYIAAQNPSIVLALLTIILKPLYRYRLIIDSHNAGIHPYEGNSIILNIISKLIQKQANITIVTNVNLKSVVELNGGHAYVLPDKIPKPIVSPTVHLGKLSVCFVCTYSEDEPYLAVIDAAKYIPSDINIVITGNYANKLDPSVVSDNVKLLGYLQEEEYWATLRSCDIVMDLTLREDCLVCGAYEGLSLNKPLILSNTDVTKNYFYKGCVYVEPSSISIATGIIHALKYLTLLESEIIDLKESLEHEWKITADTLRNKICEI